MRTLRGFLYDLVRPSLGTRVLFLPEFLLHMNKEDSFGRCVVEISTKNRSSELKLPRHLSAECVGRSNRSELQNENRFIAADVAHLQAKRLARTADRAVPRLSRRLAIHHSIARFVDENLR